MKLPFLFTFLMASLASSAQQFSAGVRTGIGFWKTEEYNFETWDNEKVQTIHWEKEGFVRAEFGKHFAAEIGVTHLRFSRRNEIFGYCGVGLVGPVRTDSRQVDNSYGLPIRFQYGFNILRSGRLKNFAGIMLAPMLRKVKVYDTYVMLSPIDPPVSVETRSDMGLAAGLENMLQYRLNKTFDIQVHYSYKIFGGKGFDATGSSIMLGASFKL